MDTGEPSRTALATAYARACHQVADRPLIFTDPLAVALVGASTEQLRESAANPGVIDRPRRLFFAARSRFAEDAVADRVRAGVRQVVILGAGLDTFGYRGERTDLRVFEVDHPATQAWKRERLADAGIEVPATLTFAPVDFETDTLAAGLAAAGFDRTAPAVFVWLGVVFYLTPEAVDATLDYIATQAAPTEVIFDYLRPPDTDEDRDYARARAERLAAEGEPVLSTTTPADLAARLRTFGFTDLEDHAAPDLLAAYDTPEFRDAPPRGLRAVRIARARRSDT